jgi:hypothetical protein
MLYTDSQDMLIMGTGGCWGLKRENKFHGRSYCHICNRKQEWKGVLQIAYDMEYGRILCAFQMVRLKVY